MQRVFSAGGIVYRKKDKTIKFLVIRNKSMKDPNVDYWGFPKGHVEDGEKLEDTAIREIYEETGIKGEIIGKIGNSKYVTTTVREGGKIFKIVTIFLLKYQSGEIKFQPEELAEADWFTPTEAFKRLSFSNDKILLQKAIKMIVGLDRDQGAKNQ